MKLEILIAMAENLKTFGEVTAFIAVSALVLCGILLIMALSDNELYKSVKTEATLRATKRAIWVPILTLLFTGPLFIMPNINDVWRIRIALIKLQLASPENLEKGSEVIERLGKKLECKYLGCDEEKKK